MFLFFPGVTRGQRPLYIVMFLQDIIPSIKEDTMKKVILDCDPGHDDAIAIMLACASSELEILGITTVAGNQTGEKTFTNALKILTLIGEDLPVARGFDKPLFQELVTAPEIHGETGLDGADLPAPSVKPCEVHAVNFIVETLLSADDLVYLVPTGPLTNIAGALLLAPGVKEKIKRIVLMGGGVLESNKTPAAEFNIYVDPEAAKIVFESGIPITMVGLDATNKALFSLEDIEALSRLSGKVSTVAARLLTFYAEQLEKFSGVRGAYLHDPLTVAAVIDPAVLDTRFLHVDIETKGEFTRGATVVDLYGVTGKKPNAEVSFGLDLSKFKGLVFDAIKRLDERWA